MPPDNGDHTKKRFCYAEIIVKYRKCRMSLSYIFYVSIKGKQGKVPVTCTSCYFKHVYKNLLWQQAPFSLR